MTRQGTPPYLTAASEQVRPAFDSFLSLPSVSYLTARWRHANPPSNVWREGRCQVCHACDTHVLRRHASLPLQARSGRHSLERSVACEERRADTGAEVRDEGPSTLAASSKTCCCYIRYGERSRSLRTIIASPRNQALVFKQLNYINIKILCVCGPGVLMRGAAAVSCCANTSGMIERDVATVRPPGE
jgi:hypothetical protein